MTGALQQGTIFFKGQKPSGVENYTSGHRLDGKVNENGVPLKGTNDISDNHGQILVASVDVAKDDFISSLGISNETLGVLLFLNTHGLENGVSLKSIVKFLTHPVINEYLHELSLSRSQFLQHNQYTFKDRNWFFENYGTQTKIIKRVLGIDTTAYNKLMYAKGKSFLDTKAKYKYLSDSDLEKNDKETRVQILDNFLSYQDTARKIASLHSSLRPYAAGKFGKSLHGLENTIDKFNDATGKNTEAETIFSQSDVARYVDSSFLTGAQNVFNSTLSMYGWMSLTSKYPVINNLLGEHVFSNLSSTNQKEYEDGARSAKNDFLSFIFTFYRDSAELKGKYSSLITGSNSIPVRLRSIKKTLSKKGLSNEALDALIPSVKEFSYETGRARENDYLYPMDKKMDISDQNTFTDALEELMDFKDSDPKLTEEVQKFARDFFEFSLYQNGIGNSPISYTKMLPNDRFVPLMDGIIKYFIDNHSGDLNSIIESFSHQFFRNNVTDKDIVYRLPKALPYDDNLPGSLYDKYGVIDDMVHVKSNASKHDYIAVRYYRSKSAARKENVKQGRRSSMEFLLYKKTDKPLNGEYLTYELTDKLGDGFHFKEYYPTYNGEGVESVISSNKYEKIFKPKVEESTTSKKNASNKGVDNRIADALYQIEASDIKPDADLNNKMKDFMDALGVTYKAVDMIKDKFNTEIPAVAVAKFSEMTLEVMEGKMDIRTLPEEASHFYVRLLDENSGLYKSMYNNIINYPIYGDVVKEYNDRYNGDEKMLREEAIGKVIADRIVNGVNASLSTRQQEQTNNWWTKLWNTIKDMFRKTNSDPYTKSAYDILTTNVEKLKIPQVESNSEMYQLQDPQEQWTELPFTAKGIYKYDYQRTIDAGEKAYSAYVNQFGSDNVTLIPITDGTYKSKIAVKKPLVNGDISESIVSKEDTAIDNMKELAKAPIDLKAEQLSINFDTYFPEQSYLDQSEKENIMKAVEGGELVLSCKFI